MNKNKYIIHIPSWYPSQKNPYSGIFVKNLVQSIARSDSNFKHILITWHENQEAPLRNLFLFIKGFFNSFNNTRSTVIDNVEYISISYFHTNEYLFGSNLNRLEYSIHKVIENIQKNFEIHLIHAHISYPAGVIANNIYNKFGIKYIITEHMSPFPFIHFSVKECIKIYNSIRQSECTVAVSNSLKCTIEKKTNKYTQVIPNVILSNEFGYSPNNISNNVFNFLSISIITEQKGIDILIKATSILRSLTSRQFKITIIGDGPLKIELVDLARKLGIGHYFTWKGLVDREIVIQSLMDCNALVCSSLHESFGVTLVEAFASGRPVVSTKCGGPEELINEFNGLLVNINSPIDLAKGMLSIMQNQTKYIPEIIHNLYYNLYSEEIIGARYNLIYKNILNK